MIYGFIADHRHEFRVSKMCSTLGVSKGGFYEWMGRTADSLKEALKEYTADDREQTGIDTEKAVEVMLAKFEVIQDMLYQHDYSGFESDSQSVRFKAINDTMNYILGLSEKDKKLFINTVTELTKAFALCATEPDAQELNQEIGFLKAVKAGLVKIMTPPTGDGKERKHRQRLMQKSINWYPNLLCRTRS